LVEVEKCLVGDERVRLGLKGEGEVELKRFSLSNRGKV